MYEDNKPPKGKTDLAKLRLRLVKLRDDRSSWLASYRDLGSVMLPRNGHYLLSGRDVSRGRRRDNRILNNTGVLAAGTLAAGFHSGMTNPAKQWSKYALPGPDGKIDSVRRYLDNVNEVTRSLYAAGNLYLTLPQLYEETGVFGTGAAIVDTNLRDEQGRFSTALRHVLHTTFLTVGTYCIAVNERGEVDTIYWETDETVSQMIRNYGQDNVSDTVKRLIEHGKLDEVVRVVHVIEPRSARDIDSPLAADMAFRSSAFEEGCRDDQLLKDSGFNQFPALVNRWVVRGQDVYGSSPGMSVLGDVNSLQATELAKAKVIDHQSNPPIVAPTSMKTNGADFLPGGVSYLDATGPNQGVRAAFEVQLKLADLDAEIARVEGRINSGMYVDLFKMLANDTRSNITAREIAERHEEKLLALGPVIERTVTMLKRLGDISYDALVRHDEERIAAGLEPLLDEPPEELQDKDITLEVEGMLVQAMKAASASAVDRFIGTVTAVAQVKPRVLDKLDEDALVDEYAEMLGVPPSIVVDDEVLVSIREARAQAEKAQAQAAVAEQASKADLNSAQASAAGAGSPTDVAPAVATAAGMV